MELLREEASESLAADFLTRIESRFNQALQAPFSGAPRPVLAPELRVMFYEKYAIYYLPRPEEIIVVRVLHGSRDIVSIAGDGGFVLGSK